MQSVFPQQEPRYDQEEPRHDQEEPRHDIQLMYSLAQIDDLLDGSKISNCATILIPLNTNDCICHFVLDRDVAIKAINKYRLSGLRTE